MRPRNMNSGPLILAHDLGTSGNKATLVTPEGRIVGAASVPYATRYPRPGWAEQEPAEWWEAIVASTRTVLEKGGAGAPERAGRIAAVGISGQMMGCLALDAAGQPLRPAMIHSDTRSEPQARALAAALDEAEFYAITGNRLDPHYPVAKIAWLREAEPALYQAARWFLQAKDYVNFRLTGALGVTDASDASLTGLYDLQRQEWSATVLKAVGLEPERLPRVVDSARVIGPISGAAARETGLREGTPVVAGGGDGACATVGAGVTAPGQAYLYLGSTAWISAVTDHRAPDPARRLFYLCDLDPRWLNVLGTVQNAGSAHEWALAEIAAPARSPAAAHRAYTAAAAAVPPGSDGLLFLPYLMGERAPIWDPMARGVFHGLSLSHTRAHMLRAVLEGVAFALRSVIHVMEEAGVRIEAVVIIGGGARGALFRQILADAFERPLLVPDQLETATALGAAAAAAVGAGLRSSYAECARWARIARTEEPDPGRVAIYRESYARYRALYPALKDTFQRHKKEESQRCTE
jgi:xylulokinase